MPGRGPQTFKKRQKEQQRKEKQQEKMAKRIARKQENGSAASEGQESDMDFTADEVDTETAETNPEAR